MSKHSAITPGPALRTWRQGGRSPAAATPQSAIYLEPKVHATFVFTTAPSDQRSTNFCTAAHSGPTVEQLPTLCKISWLVVVPQSGNLVYGSQQYNSSQRAYYVAYDLITPDAGGTRYQAVLADFIDRVQAMVSGKPVCNTPIAAAQK